MNAFSLRWPKRPGNYSALLASEDRESRKGETIVLRWSGDSLAKYQVNIGSGGDELPFLENGSPVHVFVIKWQAFEAPGICLFQAETSRSLWACSGISLSSDTNGPLKIL